MDTIACTFCAGPAHPATGCVYGPNTHRVPPVHRPLLDVAEAARQQGAAAPSGAHGSEHLVLRGRHPLAG